MALPSYTTTEERVWHYLFLVICGLVFFFLIAPIVVIMPLAFNAEAYFTYTSKMLHLDPSGFSLRWFRSLFGSEEWMGSIRNSFIIAPLSAIISTTLGTLAALGLNHPAMPARRIILAILISPMIVPSIIIAVAVFSFFARIGLSRTFAGVVLSHVVICTPFVVLTVTASLSGFNRSLALASASLGANRFKTFFKVVLPLLLPGVLSGALFAFIASFDEVIISFFMAGPEQTPMTVLMFSSLREEISPVILALADLLVAFSVIVLLALEMLRRRGERLKGQG